MHQQFYALDKLVESIIRNAKTFDGLMLQTFSEYQSKWGTLKVAFNCNKIKSEYRVQRTRLSNFKKVLVQSPETKFVRVRTHVRMGNFVRFRVRIHVRCFIQVRVRSLGKSCALVCFRYEIVSAQLCQSIRKIFIYCTFGKQQRTALKIISKNREIILSELYGFIQWYNML